MDYPKVSIIIPVYNGSNYMREAIDSALNQTYSNYEIIVVNDGSCDDGETEKIALSYGDKIRYIHKENGGSSSALNAGIKNMQGEYFSWLSHDDLYEPDRLKIMMEKLAELDNSYAVICSFNLINAEGNGLYHKDKNITGEYTASELYKNILLSGFSINGCGIMFHKSIIEKVGLFDESLSYVNDTDYWQRLIFNNCKFVFISDKLVRTRVHKGQVSVSSANKFGTENKILLEKMLEFTLKSKDKELIYDTMRYCCRENAFIVYKNNLAKVRAITGYPISRITADMGYLIFGKILRKLKKTYWNIFR